MDLALKDLGFALSSGASSASRSSSPASSKRCSRAAASLRRRRVVDQVVKLLEDALGVDLRAILD